MAETRDRAPSARKLARADARGRPPVSASLLFALTACGSVAGAVATLGPALERMQAAMRAVLAFAARSKGADLAMASQAAEQALHALVLGLAPLLGGAFAGASLGVILQVGLRFRAPAQLDEAARSEGQSKERALDSGIALLWALVLVVATAWLLAPAMRGLLALPSAEPELALRSLRALGADLVLGWLPVLVLVALLDVVQRRVRHARRLRMTRSEQHDELRETEGDPRMRAARRERMRAGTSR